MKRHPEIVPYAHLFKSHEICTPFLMTQLKEKTITIFKFLFDPWLIVNNVIIELLLFNRQ